MTFRKDSAISSMSFLLPRNILCSSQIASYLLALSETDLPAAAEEMRYAALACERFLQRSAKDDVFAPRQQAVVERVLARC